MRAEVGGPERRWSFAVRLERVLLGLLVLMVAMGALGGLGVVLTASASQRTADVDAVLAEQARAFQSLTDAETGLRGYQLTGDPTFLQPYHAGLAAFPAAMSTARDRAREFPKVEDLLAAMQRRADTWRDGYAEPAVARVGTGGSENGTSGQVTQDKAGKSSFDQVRQSQQALAQRLTALRNDALRTSRRVRAAVLVSLALALAAALAAALVATRRLTRETLQPLRRMSASLESLRGGRLSERVDVTDAPREIAEVGDAVDALAVQLQRMRTADAQAARLRAASRHVAGVARQHLELDALVTATTAAIGEALDVDRVWLRQLRADQQADAQRWLGVVVGEWAAQGVALVGDTPTARDLSPDVLARMWRHSEVIDIGDVRALPADQGLEPSYIERTGIRSLLVVPVGAGTQPLGALTLQRTREARPWDDEEVRAVQAIAADLGYALLHAELYRSQQQLVTRLRDVDRQKTEFLSMVSHELRTPLTSIAGYLELLADEPEAVTPQARRMLDVIERNASRLALLIEDLLVLSRIEAGQLRVEREPVCAGKVVAAVVDAVAAQALRSGVELVVTPGGMTEGHLAGHGSSALAVQVSDVVPEVVPDVEVLGDASHLERALLNLVSNAVKFTPAGGRVEVRTEVGDGRLTWVVSDTGIGIPERDLPQLFTRFFRAANAQAAAIPGTGLGLAIVRSILEQHGGGIEVESSEGRGSTFRAWLPLTTDAADRPEAAALSGAVGESAPLMQR